MNRYDIIIIGAGISGMSLAYYCSRQGLKPLVLEKTERVGGIFHSHRFEDNLSGFWLELGAHTCYNSYANLIGILEGCGILDRLVPREKVPFKMLVENQTKSFPSQINFLELLFSVPRIFSLKKAGLSVASYYSKIVGKKNYDKTFSHAFNGVVSQPADEFPADMLFKKRERRKDITKSFTFDQGIQSVTDALASQQGIEVLKGIEVREIQRSEGLFQVSATDGSVYESGMLAPATPVSTTVQLLRGPFPEVSEALSGIGEAGIESFGVAVKKDLPCLKPVAGIIPRDDCFYSVVSRDTVPHPDYRGFTFHFKPGLMDQAGKLSRISEVLGVDPDQLRHTASKKNALPSLKVGHDKTIRAVDKLIAGAGLLLTGNYFSGLAIEDCVGRSWSEATRIKLEKT